MCVPSATRCAWEHSVVMCRQRLKTREDLCLLTRAKGCALCTLWLYFSVSTVYAWTSPVPHSASLEPCAYDWIPILARARPQTLRVWQKSRPTCGCPSSVEGRERERNCAITAQCVHLLTADCRHLRRKPAQHVSSRQCCGTSF